MIELKVQTITFAEYKFDSGEWVEWSWDGADVYGEIRDRTKDSFTVDGNEINGGGSEMPVYKMEEYDTDSGEFTGQMVAKPQESLSSWSGPQDMSDIGSAAETMTFAIPQSQKETIYSRWSEMTNMNEEQMEMWDNSPCANAGVMDGENVRDETLMLMGQAPNGWNERSYMLANQHLGFMLSNMDKMGEDAMTGGEGTCPEKIAVEMMNRGMNPFNMMPSGNPNFTKSNVDSGYLNAIQSLDFAENGEEEGMEVDSVYSDWSDAVNMSASELESWGEHACSDEGSQNPQEVRDRNMMLLETDKSEWGQSEVDAAKRTISFINRMSDEENEPENPKGGNVGTCPSEWLISLMNWAYNPYDSMPDGDPDGEEEQNNSSDTTENLGFSAHTTIPRKIESTEGFNEYGIRETRDTDGKLEHVDALYEGMEAGPPQDRNGVRITKEFLKTVAEKDYSGSDKPQFMLDHSSDTLSKIGEIVKVWYSETRDKLMFIARVYNTGSETHTEIIKRMKHEPPQITNVSAGFQNEYEAEKNEEGETELVDGRIVEVSATPFPAGYESGGLVTQ